MHPMAFIDYMLLEWLSGNREDSGNWATQETDTILYHRTFLETPRAYTEIANQAEDGSVYFATRLVCIFFTHRTVD